MIKHFRPVTTATISVLIGLIVGLGSHIAGPASAQAEGTACKPAKCKSAKRFGSVIGLRPEKKDYYIKLHAETWPSVLQMIKKCNIRNYSIYMAKLQGKLYLFSYFEYTGDDLEADMKIMAADPEGTKPYGVSVFTSYFFENALPAYTGRAENWYKKDGEWIYRAFDPGFKEWLAFWESMYDEGILDPEFSLLQTSDVTSKFASGKIAASFNHINTVNWNIFHDPLMDANPNGEMALIIPYPSGPAGRYWVRNDGYFMAHLLNKNSDEAVIKRMLAIMDWNHTPEGENVSTFGLEGVHYTKDSSGNFIRNLEETNKDAITPGGNMYASQLGANPVLREQIEIPEIRANSRALAEYGVTNTIRIDIPLDERDDWQDVNTRFNEANNEWFPKFFIGEKSVATDFDDYLNALEAGGYAKIQAYFEKYGYELELDVDYEMK